MAREWICRFLALIIIPMTPGVAQVDPPLQVPIPPYIDRGVREIVITPGSQQGFFDIDVHWDFEGFELPFLAGETRNLTTDITFEVNGQVQGIFTQAAFILPDSGHFCDLTPCAGQICGTASDGFAARNLFCRESISCLDYPSGCDCRCGDTVVTTLAADIALTPGDVIRVTLSRGTGGFSEFTTENDSLEIMFRPRQPGLDFNSDLMHTLIDHAGLAACLNGPATTTVPTPCSAGDFEPNGTVDLYDFSRLQLAFTGLVDACVPTSPRLCWPLAGTNAHDWVVTEYVDLDPTLFGFLDHTGNSGNLARTYDGHRGTDIEVPTFRAMDGDTPVRAAAPGWVEFVRDSELDRNTTCVGLWNVITLRHANGFRTIYGHIKQNSAVVLTGDFVVPGQKLAVVGSSGCSNAAQLHFEVRNCEDDVVDPYLAGLWYSTPPYDSPLGLMDTVLLVGAAPTRPTIKDPPANLASIQVGQMLGFGLSLAGGGPGDSASVVLRQPSGTVLHTETFILTQLYQHSYWSGSATIPNVPGPWSVEVRINGNLVRSFPLSVLP